MSLRRSRYAREPRNQPPYSASVVIAERLRLLCRRRRRNHLLRRLEDDVGAEYEPRLDSLFLSTERSVVSSCSHWKNGLSGNPYVASRVISRGEEISPFRAPEVVFTRVCGHAARSITGTRTTSDCGSAAFGRRIIPTPGRDRRG